MTGDEVEHGDLVGAGGDAGAHEPVAREHERQVGDRERFRLHRQQHDGRPPRQQRQ